MSADSKKRRGYLVIFNTELKARDGNNYTRCFCEYEPQIKDTAQFDLVGIVVNNQDAFVITTFYGVRRSAIAQICPADLCEDGDVQIS